MSNLVVYIAQINQYWEDKAKNKTHLVQLLEPVSFQKNSLLILPEMFNTGFSTNAKELAEDWSDSKSIDWLKELSENRKIAITTSLIIKEEDLFYNRSVFIDKGQIIHSYDKNYLFSLAGETKSFTPGSTSGVVNYNFWNILPLICYDLRFPELSRISFTEKEEEKYDLLIYVANWPKKRIEHWNKLLQARAIENLSYCIGVNRVGKDGNDLEYNGCSRIINPLGETVLEFDENEEGIKEFEINKQQLLKIRQSFGFLKDIR
jgi:predicted amidohydrolase